MILLCAQCSQYQLGDWQEGAQPLGILKQRNAACAWLKLLQCQHRPQQQQHSGDDQACCEILSRRLLLLLLQGPSRLAWTVAKEAAAQAPRQLLLCLPLLLLLLWLSLPLQGVLQLIC